MRAIVALLLLAGCSFPELAMAPDERSGPAPGLMPLGPLLEDDVEQDADADDALEDRAAALRQRAAALPADPISPEEREAMEAVARGRASELMP